MLRVHKNNFFILQITCSLFIFLKLYIFNRSYWCCLCYVAQKDQNTIKHRASLESRHEKCVAMSRSINATCYIQSGGNKQKSPTIGSSFEQRHLWVRKHDNTSFTLTSTRDVTTKWTEIITTTRKQKSKTALPKCTDI